MAYISSLPQLQQTDREGNTITPQSQQGLLPNMGGSRPIPEGVDRSFVEGYLAMQKNSRENDETAMAASTQQMKEEIMGMNRTEWQKKQAIDAGMAEAAKAGGFDAVVDYLKTADPDRALQFMKEKNSLDQSMMSNQVYAMAHENDKSKAMLEGYSLLGGIGSTLLKAPAEQREGMYKSLLPIAKQIDPSMPDNLDNTAITRLGLGMALSTPANILYDANKKAQQYQSNLGQAMQDYHNAAAQYGVDSPEAKMLANNVNQITQMQERNNLQVANTIAKNQSTGESDLRQQWVTNTKDVRQMAQSNSAVQMASQSSQNPDGSIKGPDDMAIIYNYYKMLDPTSVIMPGEYANAENTRGWSDSMRVAYNRIYSGDKLSDPQRKAFAKSAQDLYENKSQSYYSLKSQYTDIAKRNGYNPDNVIVDGVEAYLPRPPDAHIQYLLQNQSNPQVTKDFQLKYGQKALNDALQTGGQAVAR